MVCRHEVIYIHPLHIIGGISGFTEDFVDNTYVQCSKAREPIWKLLAKVPDTHIKFAYNVHKKIDSKLVMLPYKLSVR